MARNRWWERRTPREDAAAAPAHMTMKLSRDETDEMFVFWRSTFAERERTLSAETPETLAAGLTVAVLELVAGRAGEAEDVLRPLVAAYERVLARVVLAEARRYA